MYFCWKKFLTVVSLVITEEVTALCYSFDTTVPRLSHSAQVSLTYPIARELEIFSESISEMSNVIARRNDGYVQTTSYTCFVLECGVQLMEFHPLSEFQEDTCISAYIVAGHGLVAVTELGQVSIHSFTQFAQNMMSTFGATVTPTKSSEHQVFAFKNSQLGFIPISTEDSLLTRRDTFTDLAISKIETIIAKESIILKQLLALKKFAKLDPAKRVKRSLASWILSPDIEQFSDASNKNFKTINLNFHRVTHNEEALTESMVALEKKIDTDLTAEAGTRKKLIESQTAQQFSNQKLTFINKLQELLDEVETPPALHFVQALSTNPDHCSAFECYRNSHFTSTETSLQITTQRYTLSLQQKTLLTCTLLHNNLLSAYHNQLAVIKDEEYITQSDLPPLPIATEDQKDFIARRPRDSDLLGKNILLIFDQEKMAVQCLKPQKLLLDNVELSCTNISLQWQQHPIIIKDVATQDVILGHQQYKATALRWSLQQEFEPMDLNTLLLKPLGGSVISDIKTFFEESNIYHVPIFGALGVILIILICTPCIVCLCCPACCAPFCYVCGGNRNPIVVHHARLQDKKRYATMIKHFGNPPETEEPPALEPKRSGQAIADQLVIRMKRLETQQRRTLISPLLPSAPPAETGFSNLEYESQPAYQETAASLA